MKRSDVLDITKKLFEISLNRLDDSFRIFQTEDIVIVYITTYNQEITNLKLEGRQNKIGGWEVDLIFNVDFKTFYTSNNQAEIINKLEEKICLKL